MILIDTQTQISPPSLLPHHVETAGDRLLEDIRYGIVASQGTAHSYEMVARYSRTIVNYSKSLPSWQREEAIDLVNSEGDEIIVFTAQRVCRKTGVVLFAHNMLAAKDGYEYEDAEASAVRLYFPNSSELCKDLVADSQGWGDEDITRQTSEYLFNCGGGVVLTTHVTNWQYWLDNAELFTDIASTA